ncbi:F-box protein SNE-like [Hibiscus syriacus]|uniref:F-box protein SNE-like n=1 Tax=Hibiscus syriacus TaxID=106335 RepID=UPI0019250A3F|nr:F-box protein SNE-like [Hibiscus syriacus]
MSSTESNEKKRPVFFINDHQDIVVEILKRLDGRSLGVTACVCILWCSVGRNDSLWEHLFFRHVSPPPSSVRSVIAALGGYKRLYMVCDGFQLSLSLFCVDCYERLGGVDGINSNGGKVAMESSSSSLMFLCKPLNV